MPGVCFSAPGDTRPAIRRRRRRRLSARACTQYIKYFTRVFSLRFENFPFENILPPSLSLPFSLTVSSCFPAFPAAPVAPGYGV